MELIAQDQDRHPSLIELGLLRSLVGKLSLKTPGVANRAIWIIHEICEGLNRLTFLTLAADAHVLNQVSRVTLNKLKKLQTSKDMFVARIASECVQRLSNQA